MTEHPGEPVEYDDGNMPVPTKEELLNFDPEEVRAPADYRLTRTHAVEWQAAKYIRQPSLIMRTCTIEGVVIALRALQDAMENADSGEVCTMPTYKRMYINTLIGLIKRTLLDLKVCKMKLGGDGGKISIVAVENRVISPEDLGKILPAMKHLAECLAVVKPYMDAAGSTEADDDVAARALGQAKERFAKLGKIKDLQSGLEG